jgi:hypothetical protein
MVVFVRWLLLMVAVLFRHRGTTQEVATTDDSAAIESAWKIHGALVDWTGKVDQKASFALAVESAVVAAVITLSRDDQLLAHLSGLGLWFYRVGVVLLAVAIAFAMNAVIPHLRRIKLRREWENNFIFFGHVRHWSEADLTKALREKDVLPMLSQQLVKMSDIAWKKHRHLQRSLLSAGIGTILLVLAGMHDMDMFERIGAWFQDLY